MSTAATEAVISTRVYQKAFAHARAKAYYVAYALGRYQAAHHLTDDHMASRLGVSLRAYYEMSICRMPVSDTDYKIVAEFRGVSEALLREIVKEAHQ